LTQLVLPFIWVIPFIFQGKALAGGLSSQAFSNLTGTEQFIPWVLIGTVVSSLLMWSLWGLAMAMREESYWGTLELVLASPARRSLVLLGMALESTLMGMISAVGQFALCALFFGVSITIAKILPLILVLMLLVTGVWGVGLALCGLALFVKEVAGFVNAVQYFFYLFSPLRYPVEVTRFTHIVSFFVPLTYALVLTRGIMLLNKPIYQLWREALILVAFDILLLVLGFGVFQLFERKARKVGIVSIY
jgi:ABC-2 type transport system permease protein